MSKRKLIPVLKVIAVVVVSLLVYNVNKETPKEELSHVVGSHYGGSVMSDTDAGGDTSRWIQTGPQQSWFLDFVFDPETHMVIAGGDDMIGIYRSANGEPPWEKVLGDFAAWTLAMSPHDPQVIFAGDPCGRGVMRSTDGGETWQRKIEGFPRGARGALLGGSVGVNWIEVSPHDPNTVYAAVAASPISGELGTGLWRSTDLGEHWSLVGLAGRNVGTVHVSPVDANLILIGLGGRMNADGGFMRSLDGGKTWSPVQMADTPIVNFVTDAADPNRVFMAGFGKGVFVSEDRGKTWTLGEGQEDGIWTWGVRQDPSNLDRLYSLIIFGSTSSCFISEDRGKTWRPTSLQGKIGIGLGVNYDGAVYVGTYDTGFYRSDDQGKTWRSVESGVSHSYIYSFITIDPRNPDRLITPVHYGSGSAGGIYISEDGGKTWKASTTPETGDVITVYQVTLDPRDPDHMYAAALEATFKGRGIWESTDGGRTWRVKGLEDQVCVSVAVDPASPDTVWAGTGNGLRKSTDGGSSWTERALAGKYITSITFHPDDSKQMIVATGGINWGMNYPTGFWRSRDGGKTWAELAVGKGRGAYNVAFDPKDHQRIYFAHAGGLSLSTDGGETSVVILNRPEHTGTCVVVDPSDGAVYYAGNNYVELEPELGALLRSRDEGRTWEDIGSELKTREVWWLTVDPGRRLYASTYGSGLLILEMPQDELYSASLTKDVTVDGSIGTDEWRDANKHEFESFGIGAGIGSSYIHMKNDEEFLYLLYDMPCTADWLAWIIGMDADADDNWTVGVDTDFIVIYNETGEPPWAAVRQLANETYAIWTSQEDIGITWNASFGTSKDITDPHPILEMKIPLDLIGVNGTEGGTIGFIFIYLATDAQENMVYGNLWPDGAKWTDDNGTPVEEAIETWGALVIPAFHLGWPPPPPSPEGLPAWVLPAIAVVVIIVIIAVVYALRRFW